MLFCGGVTGFLKKIAEDAAHESSRLRARLRRGRPRNDQMTKKQGSVFFGHSDFVIPSSLGIRHCLSHSRPFAPGAPEPWRRRVIRGQKNLRD
jgi:hypothetical protein